MYYTLNWINLSLFLGFMECNNAFLGQHRNIYAVYPGVFLSHDIICCLSTALLTMDSTPAEKTLQGYWWNALLGYFLAHLRWMLKWAFLITCHLSVCKLFTFSFSSPEPLNQFQPNLTQSIHGWWKFDSSLFK